MKTLNKYMLTEREIYFNSNEIGLVIIDNDGKLLTTNNRGYIDIPKIVLNKCQDKNEEINTFLSNVLKDKNVEYKELYKLESYRRHDITDRGFKSNKKVYIEYYIVKTNSEIINNKYKFLTLNNINYILESLDYKKYSESIKDELEVLLSEIKDEYLNNDRLLEFNKENYHEHLIALFDKKHPDDFIYNQYPFMDYNQIIESTLEFIKNLPFFSSSINEKKWIFPLEKVRTIDAYSNKMWYSDILIAPYKGYNDSLVSVYLLKSFFKDDINLYLNDNYSKITEERKVIGVVKGLKELIIEDKNLKLLVESAKIDRAKTLNLK